jgi:membrane protein
MDHTQRLLSAAFWWRVLKTAIGNWLRDRAPSMGAALAFYTVFSLAPLLLLVIAMAGLAFGHAESQGAIIAQVADLVGPEGAAVVEKMLRSASHARSGIIATAVGLGTLVVGATAILGELQASLNFIWKRRAQGGAGPLQILKGRLLSLSLILAFGFVFLVSLSISAALAAFRHYIGGLFPVLPTLIAALNEIFSFVVITTLIGLIFKVVPDVKVEWRAAAVGAAVSTVLFSGGKYLIGLYIGSSSAVSTHGAAGALLAILLWVYYSAQILLLGAEFAKAYSDVAQS